MAMGASGPLQADFDSPRPDSWEMTSPDGRYRFEIVVEETIHASLFSVAADASEKVVWTGEGWFAYSGYLSDDGR
ncbi:MAG: hypothetical protein AAF733_07840, partial [Verrucomicrobiota bacterium]